MINKEEAFDVIFDNYDQNGRRELRASTVLKDYVENYEGEKIGTSILFLFFAMNTIARIMLRIMLYDRGVFTLPEGLGSIFLYRKERKFVQKEYKKFEYRESQSGGLDYKKKYYPVSGVYKVLIRLFNKNAIVTNMTILSYYKGPTTPWVQMYREYNDLQRNPRAQTPNVRDYVRYIPRHRREKNDKSKIDLI